MAAAAASKVLAVSLVIFYLLLLHFAEAQETKLINGAPSPASPQTIDCGSACEGRCKLSKRSNLCKRVCGSCCSKCSCVPPGTAGNYELCPCYASLKTRNQKRKCP